MATARTLEVPVPLRRRLLHLRILTGTELPAELDVERVAEVEHEIGRTLGDPLLALLANGDGVTERFDMRLEMVSTHCREQHEAGLPPGLIGIGRDSETNVAVAAPALGLLVHLTRENGAVQMVPIEQWLDELIAQVIASLRDEQGDEKARVFHKVRDEEVESFLPCLVSNDTPKRRVHHPKFGLGSVLVEHDGGAKLEIRFDDGSTKTLLSRFLTETTPPPLLEPDPS